MADNGRISTKQRRAIAALLSTPTIGAAAATAEIGERTLATWLSDPVFRAELTAAEDAAVDEAVRQLVASSGAAVETMMGLLNDPKPAIRLRAADALLNHLLKLRELRNLESRLAALEGRYNETT